MTPNVDPGQSAFFDDFSLRAVPEPTLAVFAGISLIGLLLLLRSRRP